jgi:hypothetical protein
VDTFLTTVLAGIIVAIVGAVAAYYFGRRQSEQQGLEEKQQKENERRTEALAEISRRAHSVVAALESWTEKAAKLPGQMPDESEHRYYLSVFDRWKRFWLSLAEAIEQGKNISEEIESLRRYYRTQKSFLEPKTHKVFTSFDKALTSCYAPLWKELGRLSPQKIRQHARDSEVEAEHRRQQSREIVSLPLMHKLLLGERREKRRFNVVRQDWQDGLFSRLTEAVKVARSVDLRKHLAALDAEATRLARVTRR